MAQDSGWEDIKQFGKWAYGKATSHPIAQIEDTLNTGKPPVKKQESPAPPNPQRAVRPRSKRRVKKVSKR